MKKTVTVFGSSLPEEGDPEYETAYQLGKILGENNLNVCTGGYQGIMDAVSKGAADAGAEAIGITVSVFHAIPSKYLTSEIRCETLFERLTKLIGHGDAYIVLQGGTGTLLELSLVWEYLNKGLIPVKPVAVHDSMWMNIVNLMEKQIVKEGRTTGLVKGFEDIQECAGYIISQL